VLGIVARRPLAEGVERRLDVAEPTVDVVRQLLVLLVLGFELVVLRTERRNLSAFLLVSQSP
jgi:hypothetical protein